MAGRTAILIPSLGRPQHVAQVVGNIEHNTPEDHFQLWCVGDDYDASFGNVLGALWDGPVYVHRDVYTEDRRYVTRMNTLAKMVGSDPFEADYVFFGSDDVVFHPFWLTNALNVMENAPNAQVVVVNDLRNTNGTQALVRTSYLPLAVINEPANAFHKGYLHNFADTEMFYTAQKRGVCYRAMDSHVEHLHPLHNQGKPDGREWDETYAVAQGNWHHDATLWGERKAMIDEVLG